MIQICVMGGHEGRMLPERKGYLTIFGSCELTRPTVARQIFARRQRERQGLPPTHMQFFLTICGASEIKVPTLAEEFIDLRDLLASGALDMNDWDRAVADISLSDVSISSFTVMGAFSESELPSEDAEIESLAVQSHLGSIPEGARKVLQLGIGQREGERRATLRRALEVAT